MNIYKELDNTYYLLGDGQFGYSVSNSGTI
jgi:hypothetical protein